MYLQRTSNVLGEREIENNAAISKIEVNKTPGRSLDCIANSRWRIGCTATRTADQTRQREAGKTGPERRGDAPTSEGGDGSAQGRVSPGGSYALPNTDFDV